MCETAGVDLVFAPDGTETFDDACQEFPPLI